VVLNKKMIRVYSNELWEKRNKKLSDFTAKSLLYLITFLLFIIDVVFTYQLIKEISK